MTINLIPARPTAVDSCEAALQAHLLSGAVAPGDHLPPERALAEQLGVDRGTLRPAIARLVSQGLLTQRQGHGTVATDVRGSGSLDLLAPVIESAVARGDTAAVASIAADLLRLRRHLAASLLERAVEGGPLSDDATAPILAAVEALETALRTNADAVATGDDRAIDVVSAADVDVLGAVVTASGSLVYALALNPVKKALAACPPLKRAIAADLSESVVGWGVVTAFLQAPNADVAAMLLQGLAERDARTLLRLHTLPSTPGAR